MSTYTGGRPHLCAYCSENLRIISKLFVSFFSVPVSEMVTSFTCVSAPVAAGNRIGVPHTGCGGLVRVLS